MGVYRSELEKIIDSGYKLDHESDNELTYKKQNNYIIYDLNNDKIKEKGYQIDNNGIISKWILPYIKGQGILIKKNYKLKT